MEEKGSTIDTEFIAKRSNMISEFITFIITKAKAKAKFGVEHLCKHECERSSLPTNISTKAKATEFPCGISLVCLTDFSIPREIGVYRKLIRYRYRSEDLFEG